MFLGRAPETFPFLYQRGRMQPKFQGSSQPEHAKHHSQDDWEESKALLREQAKHWEKEAKREGPRLRLLLPSQRRKQHHLKKKRKKKVKGRITFLPYDPDASSFASLEFSCPPAICV